MSIEQDSPLQNLARSALFGALSDEDRGYILGLMRPAEFANGQLIFSRGDAGNGLYLVVSGRVRLSIITEDGRELSLAHATAGSIFGEIACLDGSERTANATAISMVKALVLSQAGFNTAMRSKPQIAMSAVRFLCARLRETDQKLEAVALHPIEARLARLIKSMAEATAPTVTMGKVTVELGMSQSEIGLLIGASRPKVNVAFGQLEAEGAFRRDGQTLVCSLATLARFAAIDE
jgi:CRP-like cAMP-binding protein